MQGLRRYSNDVVELDLGGTTTAITTNNNNSSSSSSTIDVDESTESRIQRLISEHPVIIFTRSSCCMCHVMKKLLVTIGVNPTVIEFDDAQIAALPLDVDDHESPTSAATAFLRSRSPAVFIGGACVGGLESLVALHISGHLVPKLVQVGALPGQETNMEDVQFICPGPEYSDIANISPPKEVPSRDSDDEREPRKMVEEFSPEDMLNAMFIGMDLDEQDDNDADKDYVVKKQIHFLMEFGEEISRILQTSKRLEDKETMPPVEVEEDSTSGHQWNYSTVKASPHSISTKMVAPGCSDDDPLLQEGYDDAVQQMQDPSGQAKDVFEDRLLNDNSSHLAYWLLQRFDAGEASTSEQQQNRNDVSESTLARILQFIRSPMELGEPLGQETVDMDGLDKRYWKLVEEHRALREKFEEFENETATATAPDELDSWKHQYHELMEKLNNTAHQSAEYCFTSKKHDDEELGAVLTARDEDLRKLYDYSKKCQDVKSAIYLNGLRDGLLTAQAILLALDMDETMDPLLDIPSTAGLAPSVHSFRSCFSTVLACLFMTDS